MVGSDCVGSDRVGSDRVGSGRGEAWQVRSLAHYCNSGMQSRAGAAREGRASPPEPNASETTDGGPRVATRCACAQQRQAPGTTQTNSYHTSPSTIEFAQTHTHGHTQTHKTHTIDTCTHTWPGFSPRKPSAARRSATPPSLQLPQYSSAMSPPGLLHLRQRRHGSRCLPTPPVRRELPPRVAWRCRPRFVSIAPLPTHANSTGVRRAKTSAHGPRSPPLRSLSPRAGNTQKRERVSS